MNQTLKLCVHIELNWKSTLNLKFTDKIILTFHDRLQCSFVVSAAEVRDTRVSSPSTPTGVFLEKTGHLSKIKMCGVTIDNSYWLSFAINVNISEQTTKSPNRAPIVCVELLKLTK